MMWREFSIQTKRQTEFIDITHFAAETVSTSGIGEGACLVFVPHTTAGVTINENADPDVAADIQSALAVMVPSGPFRHGEGNSHAHIKASLIGSSVMLPVRGGRLDPGTWQGVYFCEFDGPRRRKVMMTCIAGR